jgi:hypothetical protein
MMNCIDVLKKKGYDVSGYSPDTYIMLTENNITDEEECEGLLSYLEATYG